MSKCVEKSKTAAKILLISLLLLVQCFNGWFPAAIADEQFGRHFFFVQISDTHFGDRDHYERMRKIMDHINKLPMQIKCVVHTGDITQDKLDDEKTLAKGLSIFSKLQIPIHYVPGNHDILQRMLNKTKQAYINHFGELITQAEYNGVTFIFVYTEPLAKSFAVDGYEPLKQLESRLKMLGDDPVIIFHHTPSVEDFYKNKMHKGWKAEVRTKWEKLVNAYNVKAVIAGHFHRDEHHWLGKVPLYVSPPVAGYWGRQPTFRIYEYKNGHLGYRTQYIR